MSGEKLMYRYDPGLEDEVAERAGFQPMTMKGKQLRGYCYVGEDGYNSKINFEFWLKLCLDFNEKAKASKKKKNVFTKKEQRDVKVASTFLRFS